MAAELTDAAWNDIRAAAKRTPDAEARGVLTTILFEKYPAFAYDRARWAMAYQRSKRMLGHLDAFAELYRLTCAPHFPADQLEAVLAGRAEAFADDKKTERDLWCIARLRKRPEAILLAASAIRRANARRASVQREWLYHRLCNVWLEHFHAPELSYSRPRGGGTPRGPLISFMLAAIRQIMPEDALPSLETLRNAIDRERHERENAKRLVSDWRKRGMGV